MRLSTCVFWVIVSIGLAALAESREPDPLRVKRASFPGPTTNEILIDLNQRVTDLEARVEALEEIVDALTLDEDSLCLPWGDETIVCFEDADHLSEALGVAPRRWGHRPRKSPRR